MKAVRDPDQLFGQPFAVAADDRLLGAHHGAEHRRGAREDLHLGQVEDALLDVVDRGHEQREVLDEHGPVGAFVEPAPVVHDQVDVAQYGRGAFEPARDLLPRLGDRRGKRRRVDGLRPVIGVGEDAQNGRGAQQGAIVEILGADERQLADRVAHRSRAIELGQRRRDGVPRGGTPVAARAAAAPAA